jgi:hypothetical protein
MLLRDLTKVYISESEEIKEHGEPEKTWKYKGIAYLNIQQDINELDRNSAGETNYDIQKCRADRRYDIKNGDGISVKDIRGKSKIIPDYRVIDQTKIGNTMIYRMESYNED